MPGFTLTVTTILSLLGLAIAFYYMKKVTSVPLDLGLEEDDAKRLKFIHGAIAKGAMAFLKAEYRVLTVFMVLFAIVIGLPSTTASMTRITRRWSARSGVGTPPSPSCSAAPFPLLPVISA